LRPYEIGIFEEEIIDIPDFVPVHLNLRVDGQNDNPNMDSASCNHEGDPGGGGDSTADRFDPEQLDE